MKDKISHVFATLVATAIFTFAGINSAWAAPLFIGYYTDWGRWHKPAYTVDKVPYHKLNKGL